MIQPQVLEEVRLPIELKNYKKRSAIVEDCARFIDRPTIIFDVEQAKVSVVYLELEDDHNDVVEALRSIKYSTAGRTDGMLSTSRTIGYLPRHNLRRDYCSAAGLERDNPQAHELVLRYAKQVSTYYQQYNPDLYAEHQRQIERVLPEYTVRDSVFTSGIINKNNPLPYHHDTGNFKDVWSNMLVFKHKVEGGHLAVPEYDACFELKNNSLLMFDGQSLIHGVTPIRKKSREGHRFSIVFYSLQQMWKCLTPEEEVKRYRKLRSDREYKRVKQKQAQ